MGKVWASSAELPKRGTRSPTRFWEMGDAARKAPAKPPPALPTAWGVRGSPFGDCLVQDGRVPQTGYALTDPFLGDGRCGPGDTGEPSPRAPHGVGSAGKPVWGLFGPGWLSCQNGYALTDPFSGDGRCGPEGTSEPVPRAPHGVGSAGKPVWGPFGPGWPSCQNGVRARRPVFGRWEMRPGRHRRTLPPRSPRRGECGGSPFGARLGQDGRVAKTGHARADPFFGRWEMRPKEKSSIWNLVPVG